MGFLGGNDLVQEACFEPGFPRMLMIIESTMLLFAINCLALHIVQKKQFIEKVSNNMAVMTVLGLIGSFGFGKVFIESFQIDMGLMWYMFIAIALLLLYIMHYEMKSQQVYFRMHTLEMQNTILEKYYSQIDDAYKRKSKMYHEMNHHLQTIYHFLENGDSGKAAEYIKVIGSVGDGRKKEVFTGIDLIDAIFNDFENIAADRGIEMSVKSQILPLDIGFVNSDMCSLLSNLLENAMEAAKTFINVSMNHVGKVLYLKVENDCEKKPVMKNQRFLTLKKDPELHGWGTQIVEDIVKKYEGDIEYYCEGNLFGVSIMINEQNE